MTQAPRPHPAAPLARHKPWLVVALLAGIFVVLLAILGLLVVKYFTPRSGSETTVMSAQPVPAADDTLAASATRPAAPPRETTTLEPSRANPRSPSPRAAGAASTGRRSAIPEPGETFTRPIPPRTLGTADAGQASGDSPASLPSTAEAVPWHQAGNFVGKTITVEGRIVDAHNTGEVCFLNFSRDRKTGFYLILFEDTLHAWPAPPQTHFLNKTVRATGQVYVRSGRAQIRVEKPGQLSVVE